jgi:hypothetical protein
MSLLTPLLTGISRVEQIKTLRSLETEVNHGIRSALAEHLRELVPNATKLEFGWDTSSNDDGTYEAYVSVITLYLAEEITIVLPDENDLGAYEWYQDLLQEDLDPDVPDDKALLDVLEGPGDFADAENAALDYLAKQAGLNREALVDLIQSATDWAYREGDWVKELLLLTSPTNAILDPATA